MKTFTLRIVIAHFAFLAVVTSCSKAPSGNTPTSVSTYPSDPGNGGATGTIIAPTDPSVAATQGFFLDDWQPKTLTLPTQQAAAKPTTNALATVTADYAQVVSKVSKYMFGNNINPYTGFYTDAGLVANIKSFSPNIIRTPGGSLSDVYFWNGIPGDIPTELINADGTLSTTTQYYVGNGDINWQLPLDNYYNLLQQTNSTGIITVNYGYARYGTGPHPVQTAAHLAADWVRHDNGRTKYWEIGNECYGNWEACYRIDITKNHDGQPEILTGALYGQQFNVFADSMRAAAAQIHAAIKIGAVLHESPDATSSNGVTNWNADMLPVIGNGADFFIVHNYYTNFNEKTGIDIILNSASTSTQTLMSYVKTSVQNAGVVQKPIAQTEWNIFAVQEKQQISNAAGVHAVLTLGELIKQQYGQASRWDLMNGWDPKDPVPGDDQGLFSSGTPAEPNVPNYTPRPAFYYMYYFQKYFGDRMISSSTSGSPFIASYASSFSSGQAGVVLVNTASVDLTVSVKFANYYTGPNYYYYTLKGGTDNGQFSEQVFVNGNGPSIVAGGPSNYATLPANTTSTTGGIKVLVPAYGVVFLVVDKKP